MKKREQIRKANEGIWKYGDHWKILARTEGRTFHIGNVDTKKEAEEIKRKEKRFGKISIKFAPLIK